MKICVLAVFLLICPVFGQEAPRWTGSTFDQGFDALMATAPATDAKSWKFVRYSSNVDEAYAFTIPSDWKYIDCRKRSKKQVRLTIVLSSANERSCLIPKVIR